MTHVIFLMPTLASSVAAEFKNAILATDNLLAQKGIARTYLDLSGDPYLARVRNQLATKALDDFPQATDIFWLDDDLGFEAEAVVRLISYPQEVVAGVYPKKEPSRLDFPCALLKQESQIVENRSLIAASMVPTGFLRWKRSVLEKMATLRPRYIDFVQGERREVAEIFRTGVLFGDRKWYGEDSAFCREWRDLGGEIWIDPNIAFAHRGGYKWEARLLDHLAGFTTPT